jgi:hypothetical protein
MIRRVGQTRTETTTSACWIALCCFLLVGIKSQRLVACRSPAAIAIAQLRRKLRLGLSTEIWSVRFARCGGTGDELEPVWDDGGEGGE